MTHRLWSSLAVIVAWSSMVVAQGGPPQKPEEPSKPAPKVVDLTLTGCVVEATDSGVYILTNVVSTPETKDVPKTFRLVSGGEDLDFTLHTNHQVQAMGRAELKPPPEPAPAGRIDARDLPTLAVKSIRSISDRCVS